MDCQPKNIMFTTTHSGKHGASKLGMSQPSNVAKQKTVITSFKRKCEVNFFR